MHPKSIFPVATQYLNSIKVELPQYYRLAELISEVYFSIEESLVNIVDDALSENQKSVLDDLIWIDNKRRKSYKYSALSKIKGFSHSTKVKDIEDSIKNYKLLKSFYSEFLSVYQKLALPESTAVYYSEWVNRAKLFQLKQFKNRSKAYLYLLGHLKHQYFKQTDLYVNMLLKLVKTGMNHIEKSLSQHNKSIILEQKRLIEQFTLHQQSSNEVFKEILHILETYQGSQIEKDEKIKHTILEHINPSSTKDEELIGTLLNKQQSTQALRIKMLTSFGSKLSRKLNPIIQELNFGCEGGGSQLYYAIQKYTDANCTLKVQEMPAIIDSSDKKKLGIDRFQNITMFRGYLYCKIFDAVKAGQLYICSSYNFLPIQSYLIDEDRWADFGETILSSCKLGQFKSIDSTLDSFQELIADKFHEVNKDYHEGANKYLSFNKEGRFIVATPKEGNKLNKNKLAPLLSQDGIVPITTVLEKVNHATNFVRCFKHHAIKKVIMKPSEQTIFAGILGKGCNHGVLKMANISKGINQALLQNTTNWFFSLENIQAANNLVIDKINSLSLPNIYRIDGQHSHTSSDGQKFSVSVDSILSNYSFKYFGQAQGISVYRFIDDRQVLFYDTLMSPGTREAAFVIDGLLANNVIKTHIHSTDTHGYSEVIFAVMHLLGFSFAPRIKKIGAQRLYSVDSKRNYKSNHYKIKPNQKINTNLIKSNWEDILRLTASLKTKMVTASQLFSRLNSYTKEPVLYKALKEFGRLVKTYYILNYAEDVLLRQKIEKQLNRIELSNKFSKAVFFANSQEFRVGSTSEQRIIVACQSLIQNCIVLWNYLYLSHLLLDQDKEERKHLGSPPVCVVTTRKQASPLHH